MKVDFMILGAMKCGTTTLVDILRQHQEIGFSSPKEPQFFSNTENWKANLDTYHQKFTPGARLYGEGSTNYTKYPHFNQGIWEDIYAYNPDMKFIYIIRNPFDRIVSHYMHSYERGFTDLELDDALSGRQLFMDTSRYFSQISPFVETFGREKVLILDFDELVKTTDSAIARVIRFLGIDMEGFTDRKWGDTHSNTSLKGGKVDHRYHRISRLLQFLRRRVPFIWRLLGKRFDRSFDSKLQLTLDQKRLIVQELKTEIDEIGKLVGKDYSHWLTLDKP